MSLGELLHESSQSSAIHPYAYRRQIANFLKARGKVPGDTRWLDTAIQLRRDALTRMDRRDEFRSSVLSDLGADCLDRFKATQQKDDIDSAIQAFQEAHSSHPGGGEDGYLPVYNTGIALRDRYRAFGSLTDLDLAIQNLEKSLSLAPGVGEHRPTQLKAIGCAYAARYRETQAEGDGEKARKYHDAILAIEGLAKTHITQAWFDIADVLVTEFQSAITPVYQEPPVLDLLSASETSEGGGSSYQEIYERNGLQKLDEIIRTIQRSLQETLENDPWKAERLEALAFMHFYRYTLAKDESDREKAASILELALSLTPERSRGRVESHERLGDRHRAAYQTTNSEHHLQAAIDHWTSALEGTPSNHPKIPSQLLNLGELYMQRSFRYGDADDLERAQSMLRRGLEDPQAKGLVRQRLLVAIFSGRPINPDTLKDIQAAIQGYNEELRLAPQGSEQRVKLLTGLGSAHLSLFQRDTTLRNLEIGVQHLEDAVTQASGLSCDISFTHMHLATARMCYYAETNRVYDIDKAIEHYHEALKLGRQNVNARPNFLSRLSEAYKTRYSITKDPSDLDKAVATIKDALDQTPADHPARGLVVERYMEVLLRSRGGMTGTTKDDRYLRPLQEGLDQPTAMTFTRIQCGASLARLYMKEKAWRLAHQVLEKTIALVPRLAPQSLESSDKQHHVRSIIGIASDAAAIALQASQPPREALRLLESGRGIIRMSLNSLRTDISELERGHPDLAASFIKARSILDAPWSPEEAQPDAATLLSSQQADMRRSTASQELEATVHSIREKPGFERFLLGPSEDEIMAAAALGPMVVINVSLRCDAFIVSTGGMQHLWLPRLSIDRIKAWKGKLNSGQVQETLEWLWKVLAQPVLAVLGYTSPPLTGAWPRICWIPTGSLSQFPIHAAGLHLQGGMDTLLDRAISTYGSSLRSVVESRQIRQQSASNPQIAALVGDERTLPNVRLEIDSVMRICKDLQLQVTRPRAMQEEIMSTLDTCDIFHFAGHGRAHRSDPLQSALSLNDGPLTLETLLKTNLSRRRPFLAYLSACGTGQVHNQKLVDEGLHLIAACQLAGFRNVIGTLWKVEDEVCVAMAESIYLWMKTRSMSAEALAESLHHASRKLRTGWVDKCHRTRGSTLRPVTTDVEDDDNGGGADRVPVDWVPFVLFGS